MKNDNKKSNDAADLRRRAEERLKNTKPPKPAARSVEDALQLLHELEVHQIELEMQNEELRRSRAEVEAGFERYIDLYDFAPVGYLSTDCEGTISELNLAAAGLLGAARSELLGRRLGLFVSAGSQLAFNAFLEKACTSSAKETREVTLTRKGKDPRQVRIEAIGSENGMECRIVLIDVTDQKQAEQALRVSEERFRVAQELSPDGFTILRPVHDEQSRVIDFTWVYQNPTVARLAGTDPQKVLGKSLLELFPGHRGSKFFEVYKQVAETHEPCVLESEFAADIPTPRWLRVAVVPIAADIAILAQDITDRKKVEDAARSQKETLETIINRMPAAVCLIRGSDLRIQLVNPAYQSTAPGKEMVGKTLDELWPETGQGFVELCRKVLATGEPYHVVDELNTIRRSPEGPLEQAYFTWSMYRVRLPGEEGLAVLNTHWETTARVLAEQALRESETRLSLALDSGQMGLWEWDVQANRSVWNAKEYEILGLPVGEGREPTERFFQHVHPDDLPRLNQSLAEIVKAGDDWREACRIIRPNGEVRWVAAVGRVLRNSDGQVMQMIGVNYDITDRKKAEAALTEAKIKAEQANQAKDHFLATLSHELRTPLAPILAAAQLLERREDLPVSVWEYVDAIKRNVALEARLIDDLLDLSKITHGKISLSIHDVDVHEVIRRAAETCQATLHEKEQKLVFRLNAKSHVVRGDWSRLQQILWNLLSNAVKFTPSKSQIEISTEDIAGGDIEIKVSDHGKGIAPEDLPKIFTAFEQGGSSVTRDFGGLGLGLAISRGLAEMHHGTLKAFSEGLGRGSTFVLTLHAETETETETETAGVAAQPVSRRILIVEDNEDTGRLMKIVLDRDGHTVHHVNSVTTALKAAEQEKFDLLICDIGLPDGSGFDVVSSLRKRNAVDKAIAMTGYGMAEDVDRCRKAGFDTHLTKPVDIEDLERLIAML